MEKHQILVLGSGSWGLALSQVLSDNNHDVFVYGNNKEEIDELNSFKTCKKFFGDLKLNSDIRYSNNLNYIFNKVKFKPEVVLICVPSNAVSSVLNDIKPYIKDPCIILNAAKGFTSEGYLISDLVRKVFTNHNDYPFISLLGPSHAEEVIEKKLTFVNIVDKDLLQGYFICNLFTNSYFKTFISDDELGSQLLVSFKNIVALLSGMFTGLGYGDNAKAALFSIALSEMYYLLKAFNIDNINTVLGLTGSGDLAVTCYSNHSRNFCAGKLIGELNSFNEFIKINNKTVEGINAIKHFYPILKNKENKNLNLPIINCVWKIVNLNIKPSLAINELINISNKIV